MNRVATFRLSTYFILSLAGLAAAGLPRALGRDVVWVGASLPAGAIGLSDGEGWDWVPGGPAAYAAVGAHRSSFAPGLHEHYFNYAAASLRVGPQACLFAYVKLDPAHPPAEIMLSWNAGRWGHRAYWGADRISYGRDGTDSRRYMGPLPTAGRWVRLEVPADAVGLGGREVAGMAFTEFDGRVSWSCSGTDTASPCSQSDGPVLAANIGDPAAVGSPWVGSTLPAGAEALSHGDAWNWVQARALPVAGTLAHRSGLADGLHEHYFNYASAGLSVGPEGALYTYVYLDPAHPPAEIMLEWNDGTWSHRAYWGADRIAYGRDGTESRCRMGPLPAAGRWVRLTVPASEVGLAGREVTGMGFSEFGGRATWDASGAAAPVTTVAAAKMAVGTGA